MKEEETHEEEAGEEDEPMTDDDYTGLLIDAEVHLRAGIEKVEVLVDAGLIDKVTLANLEAGWNVILSKIDNGED